MNRLDFDRSLPGPVLGIDEVGVGAVAGPLTACGVILPQDDVVERMLLKAGARDSKKLTSGRRVAIDRFVRAEFVWHFIVQIEAHDYRKGWMNRHLDELFRKILNEAIQRGPRFGTVIIDGSQDRDLFGHTFRAIPGGDDKSLTVALASIMAKVHRDKIMTRIGRRDSRYGFGRHKGYPTETHIAAIKAYGALPGIHRDCKTTRRLMGGEKATRKLINGSLQQRPEEGSDACGRPCLQVFAGEAALRARPGSGRFH